MNKINFVHYTYLIILTSIHYNIFVNEFWIELTPLLAPSSIWFAVEPACSDVDFDELKAIIPKLINKIDINIAPAIIKAFDAFSIKYSSFEFLIFIFWILGACPKNIEN